MITFREFRKESKFAIENLILEKKGFGDVAKKRRKKKYSYLSPRSAKIKSLQTSSDWPGLEPFDVFS